jgi:VWFA-related protein
MRVAVKFAVTVVAALCAITLHSQSPVPQFRSAVDLRVIDVSVLDDRRRPVTGLTAADFVLSENGVEQTISTFQAIEVPSEPAGTAEWQKAPPEDVVVNRRDDARLLAMVIDDATLPPDPYMVNRARDTARDVIEKLGPGDLGAVIFTRDNRHAQDFTRNKPRLLAAAARTGYGFVGSSVGPGVTVEKAAALDMTHYLASLNTLERVAEHLEAVPQRRKVIAYLSVGVPVDMGGISTITLAGTESPLYGQSQQEYLVRLRRIIDRAARANVTVYALDPSGVDGIEGYNRRTKSKLPGGGLFMNMLRDLAAATGGRAFTQTNDYKPGIEQMFAESGTYYLLGYVPSPTPSPGAYRRLEVRSRRPATTTIARQGYFAPGPEEAKPRRRSVTDPIAAVLPDAGLPLRASAVPLRLEDGASGMVVTLSVNPEGTSIRPGDRLDVVVGLFDAEGRPRGAHEQRAAACAAPGTCEISTVIAATPGRYAMRAAVTHAEATGSVYFDADIPRFDSDPVTASGLVLHARPGWPSTADTRVKTALSLRPTTRRDFASSDAVTLHFRIYQREAKRAVAVTREMEIVNDRGTRVFHVSDSLAPAHFEGRGWVEQTATLPTADLGAGSYLLRVVLNPGSRDQVERQLTFRIR